MLPSERLRVLVVLFAAGLLYGCAGLFLLDGIRRRLAGRGDRLPPWEKWARRIVMILAVTGVVCVLYARFVEPYWLKVTTVQITTSKLPQGSRPLRIVHISDFHCEAFPRLEEKLPTVIAALHPDIIVFTGDAVNSPAGLPVFKACMKRIAEIAPTFAVRGNFDVWFWDELDLFGGTGVTELISAESDVKVAGTTVRVVGVPVGEEGIVPKLARPSSKDGFTVFLYHYPDLMPEVVEAGGVDLYCAGHTHGGQVALPGYGALVTLSRFDKRYERGLYHEGHTWLNVSSGVGMEGGAVPRVRFMVRPEVCLIVLSPER